MGLTAGLVQRFGGRRWFVAAASRLAPRVDRAVFAVTGGRRAASELVAPTLLLVSTGHRSGERRRTPLFYLETTGGYAVVGTNFGRDHHPAWVLNLVATPEAAVVLGGRTIPVRARPTDEAEHAALWRQMVDRYPVYAEYAALTPRRMRIFVLEPTS